MTNYQTLINPLCDLALAAGEAIMRYYRAGDAQSWTKEDQSPVTDADMAAHRMIVEALAKLTPNIPIISEENAEHPALVAGDSFWLVDPLDGTKSFMRKSGEFTVNIGLIEKGKPVVGVISIPAKSRLFYGCATNGAYKQEPNDFPRKIKARSQPEEGAAVVVSHSHLSPETENYLQGLTITSRVSAASSLKFCAVAEGKADIYPRFGRTMEWDTAAGHAILSAAGGEVETTKGVLLPYGKPGFENAGFIAFGKREAVDEKIEADA